MKVFVQSAQGTWLMPTHPAKARVLLKQDKARVIRRTPFCIQLTYQTTEYVQPVTVGVDDGGKKAGIAAVSNRCALYQEEIELRDDIRKNMDTRRALRRGRRYRKTRYRKCRFLNRKVKIPACKVCGGNAPRSKTICRACLRKANNHHVYAHIKRKPDSPPPSIKAKKDAIVRVIQNLPLPVCRIILEDAYFDLHALNNPNVSGEEYQYGPRYYHQNIRKACLVRDGNKCRVCGSCEELQAHHVVPRAEGGSDRLSNRMTLCRICHDKHHQNGMVLPKQHSVSFASSAHVQQGKNYLYRNLSNIAPATRTFGYITADRRKRLGIAKSHVADAAVIAGTIPCSQYLRTLHVRSRKRSLHEANPRKGRKAPNHGARRNTKNKSQLKGFCRHDKVIAFGLEGYIASFAGSFACRILDKNGNYIRKPGKSYSNVNLSKIRRVHANRGMVSFLEAV